MKTSRKIILSVFLVLISIVSCFCIGACSSPPLTKLSNASGFVVEGGNFAEGSVLVANAIDRTSAE